MLELNTINAFYGKAHILHDVSFRVEPGQVVALLGRNGAGKTTTLKTIMGLLRTRVGDCRFEEQNISRWPPHRIAQAGIGYVPEERRIFTDLTVVENLEVGRRPARADLPEWTCERLFELFPNLRERQNNRGKALSGGEQQMLSIARTLMGNPKLILMDEPSEGIAPVIVDQLADTIRQLKQYGVTILLSEQNLHFATAVTDRGVIIESGSIRFDGPMSALVNDATLRHRYLAVS